uniref:Inositol-phosphate phosphatase n=1 Tax=Amphiprion ocellaris TaxID=80972 RepID=A0AAQ5XJH2_AMPOC
MTGGVTRSHFLIMADWTDCLNFGISIVVLSAFQQHKEVKLKSSPADLVTETDQRVEKILISAIRNRYPSAQESVAAGEHLELTDSPTWIIDPIDGTVNFVHRFPFVAISIAFTVNRPGKLTYQSVHLLLWKNSLSVVQVEEISLLRITSCLCFI